MDKSSKTANLFSYFFMISLSLISTTAQTCNNYTFRSNKVYTLCNDLPYLNAFLHWNYHPANGTVDIAYRYAGLDSSAWVAWAINLKGRGMKGAQALVALHRSSGVPYAYTSSVDSYDCSLAESGLSFQVPSMAAEYVGNEMIIFATLVLPGNQTRLNQVWQEGPVTGGTPQSHSTSGANMKSMATVDFVSGQTSSGYEGGSDQRKKNVHGMLNAIGWGTLMPVGAMTARYMKVFKSADPAWFYLHVACQCTAYVVGTAGWAIGFLLGGGNGVTDDAHRNIGITLFCLGTIQVFALLLRPKKDHKYRLYWNIYHWSVGYAVIILSVVNVFEGFELLDPGKNWKRAYVGILIFLGFNAALLEAYTWCVVLKRKKKGESQMHITGNGENQFRET